MQAPDGMQGPDELNIRNPDELNIRNPDELTIGPDSMISQPYWTVGLMVAMVAKTLMMV